MNQLGQFEQDLLTELREVVAGRATVPPPRRALPRKRLTLATAAAGLLAAGLLFGVPALSGEQTPAAYAVATNDDGTVTITINRLDDPEGLERDLAAHGITADIDFAPPGKGCQMEAARLDSEAGTMRPDANTMRISHLPAGAEDTMTVRLADVEGKTLVIRGSRLIYEEAGAHKDIYTFEYHITNAPVVHCVMVDTP
jgi:hypothetical protein